MTQAIKPSYGTTKAHLFASSMMAWIVILALTAGAIYGSEQAVAFGMMAVPTMAGMLCAMLGLHRRYGSKDFEVLHSSGRNPTPSSPPYDIRADPSDGNGETR
ncbi:NAD(P)+ transhydrogenase beta chain [Rhizobium ruizarguesonis]